MSVNIALAKLEFKSFLSKDAKFIFIMHSVLVYSKTTFSQVVLSPRLSDLLEWPQIKKYEGCKEMFSFNSRSPLNMKISKFKLNPSVRDAEVSHPTYFLKSSLKISLILLIYRKIILHNNTSLFWFCATCFPLLSFFKPGDILWNIYAMP